MHQSLKTPLLVASTALIASAIGVVVWKRIRRSFVKVGKISKLYFYPVKSLKAVEVAEGTCTNLGFVVNGVLDRSFMIVDAEMNLLSQREAPSLVLLTPKVSGNILLILAPSGEELKIEIKSNVTVGDKILKCTVHTDEVNAVDCGDEAAAFFQKYLQRSDLRLVRYFPSLPERKFTKKDPFYSKVKKDHPIGFQDLGAIHLVSEASVGDLNSKMNNHKVTALNFRPNVVITECKAFAEDSWRFIKFQSGAELSHILTTTRCLMTTNDIETGVLGKKEPLVTLRKYRIHGNPNYLKKTGSIPCMGVTLAVLKSGKIRVGEEFFADVGPEHMMVNKIAN